jgi:hypothetical protein
MVSTMIEDAELGGLAVGLVRSKRELSGGRHFERRRVTGKPTAVTDTACSLVGLYQTRVADFVGVDHNFSGPVVGPSTVTRLALHAGQRGRPGGVTTKAARGRTLDTEASRGPGVCGRAPTHIGRTVTELAALRADEGGLVEPQTEEGKRQGETTSGESIRHPFSCDRLARANPRRQGVESHLREREGIQ